MEKITRFKDIKQFTTDGNYNVCYPLPSLVKYISEEIEEMGLQLNPEFKGKSDTEHCIAFISF
jgi:hypothetical protein